MFRFILPLLAFAFITVLSTSCANIIPPGGGPRDSLPPVLISAVPADSALNVNASRVTLTFNEFVEIQNAMENVVVSPLPKNSPIIDYRLRNVTVRLRDTLEPNTTYSINFGNAIKDINEGNILRNFVYVFSTGSTIDSNTISGKVMLAETGKIDSTLIVVLHRNLDDSAVAKEKPRYLAKLDGEGNFLFPNLPAGTFAIYAIPNEYSRQYDDSTKLFAFASNAITLPQDDAPIVLYAYNYPKAPERTTTATGQKAIPAAATQAKELRYGTNLESGNRLDLLKPQLELIFNRGIFRFDSNSVVLTNQEFTTLPGYTITRDTNQTTFYITYPWKGGEEYNLLISQQAFEDSAGATLPKGDTITITTKRTDEYGSVRLRFNNLDLAGNPVLLLVQNEKIVETSPITGREWNRKLFPPGEYDIRILYDNNGNGVWDPGSFFGEKRQPEIVDDLGIKLSVRGNWDNEKDITL